MSNSEHPQVDNAEVTAGHDLLTATDPAQTDVVQADDQPSGGSDGRRTLHGLMSPVTERARRRGDSGRTTIAGVYREHTRRSQAGIAAVVLLLIAAVAALIRRLR